MSAWWIIAFVSLWLVVMIVALIVLGFLRRVTAVLERAEIAVTSGQVNLGGARAGMEIEPFQVVDRSRREVTSHELFVSPSTYLLLHSGCEPCRHLVDRIRGLRPSEIPVIAILDDTPAGRETRLPSHVGLLFDHDGSVGTAFRIGGTPQAFAVAEGGVIVETLVPSSAADIEHLTDLLREGGDAMAQTSEVVHVA